MMGPTLVTAIVVLLVNTLTVGSVDAKTTSTSTENDFIVQTLVAVDPEAVAKWKKVSGKSTTDQLKAEVASYLVEVNDVYKSLSKRGKDLKIQFEKPKIEILDRNILYSPRGTVNAENAKYYLQRWTKENSKTFDIAILLTGYDIESRGDTGTVGHANKGTVCQANAVLVAELSGRYIDPLILAHEIGHVLDADHDGFLTSASCPMRDYYVMTPGLIITSPHKYFFSQCSYDAFYKLLVTDKRGKDCLKDGDKDNIATGPRLGTLVTPDSMCQRRYGSESRADRLWYQKENGYDTDLCNKLRCVTNRRDPYDTSLPWVATHQGMSCGKDQRCDQGVCKTAKNGDAKVSNSCPLGDQTTTLFSKRDCASLKPDECYNWQAECCHTCANFKDSVADRACRKLEGPKSSLVRDRYTNWGDEVCQALYCAKEFHSSWDYKKYDTPSGMDCGKNKKCQNKKCVAVSSGGDPTLPDLCPFGDQPWIGGPYKRTCPAIVDYYGCVYHRWAPMCCQTCAGKLT